MRRGAFSAPFFMRASFIAFIAMNWSIESGRVGFDLGQASKEELWKKFDINQKQTFDYIRSDRRGVFSAPFLCAPDKSSRDKHCG